MADRSPPPALAPVRWLDRSTPPHIATLVLIAGMGALNMNIFLPSLPSIADYYQADYAVVQLAISAYLAVTAVLQLIFGPLSDRFGRRPVMIGSMVIFLIASIGCILADSIFWFLVFRLIQASVASGIALSRAIVRDMVPPAKAASMIGYVTMGMALVPMVGPMIGGYLDEWFGFHATIAATAAFGAVVLVVIYLDQGETNITPSGSFGAQFRTYPSLVTSRRFWGYALVAACASGAFFAFLGGGPFVATEILGMSPSSIGLHFGLIALGYMLGNYLSGRYAERVGITPMMITGSLVACMGLMIGIALFALGIIHPLSLFGTVLLVGIGNGLTLPSANAGIVSVRPNLAGSASGLGGALMIGGGAALSAVTGSILNPQTGGYILMLMMLLSSFMSLVCANYVLRRERALAAQG